MERRGRFAIAWCAGVALGWIAFEAAATAIAGDASFDANLALDNDAAGTHRLSSEALSQLHDDLSSASKWAASDASLHEEMGVADVRRSGSQDLLQEAGDHFAVALRLRPVSPYTWADLAAQKYRIGDTGPVFERALINAANLGPFEPAVQATVANFGLAVWNEKSAPVRAAVETIVGNGMKRDPQVFLQIAERRGRLDVACRHYIRQLRQGGSKWDQTCQSMEATS